MEQLLPYYERELMYLRTYSREFAERYPKIAARLAMSDGVSEDPHVERLMQSFAFLGARINKKLDDDYPEFTEALLEVLYPHYLRPFPSCSIAQFVDNGEAKNTSTTIPRPSTTTSTSPQRSTTSPSGTTGNEQTTVVKPISTVRVEDDDGSPIDNEGVEAASGNSDHETSGDH